MAMTEQRTAPGAPISRRSLLGRKWLFGYLPMTALSVALVVLAVGYSRSWAAALAGGFIAALWSAQTALTNVAILVLRYDAKFSRKAMLVALSSVLLLPGAALIDHQLKWVYIGEPDLAEYIGQASDSRCRITQVDAGTRFGRDYTYVYQTRIQCRGEPGERSCRWRFDYHGPTRQWKNWTPALLGCTPR